MMVEFPWVGQNFAKLEKTAENPLKIKKNTRQYKSFISRTLQKPLDFRLKQYIPISHLS